MNDRVVKQTTIEGVFAYPLGFSFFGKAGCGEYPRDVLVSTVQLDGGHLEDPLAICEAETGYETMVFLGGSAMSGSLHTARYRTRTAAAKGHAKIVTQIMTKTLPLTVSLHYCAWEALDGDQTQRAKSLQKSAA